MLTKLNKATPKKISIDNLQNVLQWQNKKYSKIVLVYF